MAPSTNNEKMLMKDMKHILGPTEIERLACVAIEILENEEVERAKIMSASERFGANVKADSFRRSVGNTMKKIKNAQATRDAEMGGLDDDTAPNEQAGPAEAAAGDNDEGAAPGGEGGGKQRKGRAYPVKKAKPQ